MLVPTDELPKPALKTLNAVQGFINQNGFPPTVEELADVLSKTKATIHANLATLMERGYIKRTSGKARSIEVLQTPHAPVISLVAVPLLGTVPAGIPIVVEEHYNGEVLVETSVVGDEPCFALRVLGDSMIDADILDGDVLVVRQQPLAACGEIVVAAIDGEVTVKRLELTRRSIRLLPENFSFQPIEITHANDLKILGKVIATRRVRQNTVRSDVTRT